MSQLTQILNILNAIMERQKQLSPKIEFRKFDKTLKDKSSNIIENDFYNLPGVYYLLNGANKTISGAGGGTTGALSRISQSFFDHNKFELIYDSQTLTIDKIVKNIICDSKQIIQSTNDKTKNKCAGSVFFINSLNDNIQKNGQTIGGVYHINGIDWDKVNMQPKPRNESIP